MTGHASIGTAWHDYIGLLTTAEAVAELELDALDEAGITSRLSGQEVRQI